MRKYGFSSLCPLVCHSCKGTCSELWRTAFCVSYNNLLTCSVTLRELDTIDYSCGVHLSLLSHQSHSLDSALGQSQWGWNHCNLTLCFLLLVALIQCRGFLRVVICSLYSFLPSWKLPAVLLMTSLKVHMLSNLILWTKQDGINNWRHSNSSVERILIIIEHG